MTLCIASSMMSPSNPPAEITRVCSECGIAKPLRMFKTKSATRCGTCYLRHRKLHPHDPPPVPGTPDDTWRVCDTCGIAKPPRFFYYKTDTQCRWCRRQAQIAQQPPEYRERNIHAPPEHPRNSPRWMQPYQRLYKARKEGFATWEEYVAAGLSRPPRLKTEQELRVAETHNRIHEILGTAPVALPPKNAELTPTDRARIELARRELARRSLVNFILRFHSEYKAGWVHQVICAKLEKFARDVKEGRSPRLMLFLPPRSGKSQIASKLFPAWFLGHYPTLELIACSYAVALPIEFSRAIRDTINLPTYKALFPETLLSKTSSAAEAWRLQAGGGYVAAGVSGPITGKGAHCVAPYSTIRTRSRGIIPISKAHKGEWIYGYDHVRQRPEWVRIDAICVTRLRNGARLLSLTPSGPVVTPEHQVFIPGRGYTPASESQGLSLLRSQEGSARCDLQEVPPGRRPPGVRGLNLLALWEGVPERLSRAEEDPAPAWGERAHFLLSRLLSRVSRRAPAGVSQDQRDLRTVRGDANREKAQRVLLVRLLQSVQSGAAYGARVFWQLLGPQVGRICAGPAGVPALWEGVRENRCPSHRLRPGKQRINEPDYALQDVPRVVSHADGACAEDLAALLSGEGGYVVDLQTSSQNFFCDDVLVHNCLILDDVVKDAESADSEVISEATWNWYGSTARTRLAPGGGILVIMTRWSEKDLAGRLLYAEHTRRREIEERALTDPSALDELATLENWEVLSFPAIAEHDEYLTPTGDLVYTTGEGQVLLRKQGEALHPERFDLNSLLQVRHTLQPRHWQSLYQQNPTPETGSYFAKEMVRYEPERPEWQAMTLFAAWDLAIGQRQQNDWTVGVIGAMDWNGDLHIVDMIRGRMNAHEIALAIVETAWKYGCLLTGIEKGQLELAIRPELERVMRDTRRTITLAEGDEALRPMSDKLARARALQGMMQRGRIVFPADQTWTEVAVSELLRFPNGLNDDIVDALAWLARMTINASPPTAPEERFRAQTTSWKDKLKSAQGRKHFMAA